MPRWALASLAAAAFAIAAFGGGRAEPPCASNPRCFRACEAMLGLVPDADLVFVVREAGQLMDTPAGAGVRSLVAALVETGAAREARGGAALLSRGGAPATVFAELARKELRVARREGGAWVARARLEPEAQRRVLAAWRPSVELDGTLLDRATGIVFRTGPEWLTLASNRASLPEADPTDPTRRDRSETASLEAIVRRGDGRESYRIVGECAGETLSLRLRLPPDVATPIPSLGGPPRGLDPALLDRVPEEAILVEVSSIRTTASPEDGVLLAALPELLPSASFRANLGTCRVLAIGEIDGATLPRPLAMRCPTIAVAYEVEDVDQARADQDALLLGALRALRTRIERRLDGEGGFPTLPTPNGDGGTGRDVDLRGPIEATIGPHPVLSAMTLAWRVAERDGGAWQVYATHPAWRDRLASALGPVSAPDAERDSASVPVMSLGRLDGVRLADHLESWLPERARFAGDPDRFADGMRTLARLVRHVERLEWRAMRRGGCVVIDLRARLAATE